MKRENKSRYRKAVSLKYETPAQEAPIVTSKGQGFIADKIISLAKKHRIPIKEDPDLVQLLAQLDIGQQIPSSVYQVVAEIFAFIYHLNRKYQE
jgi:flagellar biosynthesis protein